MRIAQVTLIITLASVSNCDPLTKIVIPHPINISELRKPGSIIFDFNDYFENNDYFKAKGFRLMDKPSIIYKYLIIIPTSGHLILKEPLDHEYFCESAACKCDKCIFEIEIYARSVNHYFIIAKLFIENANDNSPIFPVHSVNITIDENSFSPWPLPKAFDSDYNSKIAYKLLTQDSPFDIRYNNDSLELIASKLSLKNEKYLLRLSACDTESGQCSFLTINVKRLIEASSDFLTCPANPIRIYNKDLQVNDHLYTLETADEKEFYLYIGGIDSSYFYMENSRIYLAQPITYQKRKFNISMIVSNSSNQSIQWCNISMEINQEPIEFEPLNDVLFFNTTHVVFDSEIQQQIKISAQKLDTSVFHNSQCWRISSDKIAYFTCANSTLLECVLLMVPSYQQYLCAAKKNENRPKFMSSIFQAYFYNKTHLKAEIELEHDDINQSVKVITDDYLNIMERAHLVKDNLYKTTLIIPINHNLQSTTIHAIDDGWPQLSSNSASIQFPDASYGCAFSNSSYHFIVSEGQKRFGPLEVYKRDSNALIDYLIYPQNAPFAIKNNFVESLTEFDREDFDNYKLLVQAVVKTNELSVVCSESTLKITVTDINDNYPEIKYPVDQSNVTFSFGKLCIITYCHLLTVSASDKDLGLNAKLNFKLLSPLNTTNFYILQDGKIFYHCENVCPPTESMYFKVQVSDSGNISLSNTTTFYVSVNQNSFWEMLKWENSSTFVFSFLFACLIITVLTAPTFLFFSFCRKRAEKRSSNGAINLLGTLDSGSYGMVKTDTTKTDASNRISITSQIIEGLKNEFKISKSKANELIVRNDTSHRLLSDNDPNFRSSMLPQWLDSCERIKTTLI